MLLFIFWVLVTAVRLLVCLLIEGFFIVFYSYFINIIFFIGEFTLLGFIVESFLAVIFRIYVLIVFIFGLWLGLVKLKLFILLNPLLVLGSWSKVFLESVFKWFIWWLLLLMLLTELFLELLVLCGSWENECLLFVKMG